MASKHTTLCIVNTTGMDITNINVYNIDNYDWDGDSRPDHNFQGKYISNNNSMCEREELNAYARSAWYNMTLTFSDGTNLSFRNNQHDAFTKYDRFYETTGSASEKLTIYQTSGGDTNAMYIRTKEEPHNSNWMGDLLKRKPGVRLNELTMPGSHDAGMYSTHHCSIVVEPEWTITQSYTIEGQLKTGSRYFDLRVYRDGSNYRIGHFSDFGGCYGTTLSDVLNQVKTFIQDAQSEAIVLTFTHTGDNVEINYVVNQVKTVFGNHLYTTQNIGADLAKTLLSELAGKVVAVFGNEYASHYDVTTGIFPYREYPKSAGYGLRVYDEYSNTTSLSKMWGDQINKLAQYGGYGNDYLFLLSWTLTGDIHLLDIQVLSALARPWLPQITTEIQNKQLKLPNIIYYDYVDPYINQLIINLNNLP